MFRWAKMKNEKNGELWKSLSDTRDEDVKMMGEAFHLSLYYYEGDSDGDQSKLRMAGDLTLDIDDKDLSVAIRKLNSFLDLLESKYEVNLDYVRLYCSGSKGFHIVLPQKLMEDKPKAIPHLNRIHGWMVAVLGNECNVNFDMSLYHQKHLIRSENKPREDGRYKVRITTEEARTLTVQQYQSLVSQPRQAPTVSHIITEGCATQPLIDLWEEAKTRIKEIGTQTKISPVPDEQLALFTDKPPLCIEWQANGDNLHRDSQFNRLSMNVASFIAHAGALTDAARSNLVDTFVKHAPSSSKDDAAKRRHLDVAIRSSQTGNQQFGCGFNRSQLGKNPCNGCPIKEAREAESELLTQIETREDGYYSINSKGEGLKLTTFTLERKNEILEYLQGRRILVGEAFEIKVSIGKVIETQEIDINTQDWTSLSTFKKTVSSVSGAIVKATSDVQLANLREYINNSQLREGLMRNELVGVQIGTAEDGNEERVWLEPGWSVNSKGVSSSYHYTGTVTNTVMPLRGIRPASSRDGEVFQTLTQLMDSNRPEAVGQMLGWACACHLKSHMSHLGFNEFPLLHISGKPSSGKTYSAQVYSAFTGAQYLDGPMTAETATAFPLKSMLSETTSVARILDEFNKGQLSIERYNLIYGYLKALYCRQTTATGYAGKANSLQKVSAAVIDKAATSPMIFMAKETTENEELRARSIIVRISKNDHRLGKYSDNFQGVWQRFRDREANGNAVQRITKLMVTKALRLSTQTVQVWMDEVAEDMKEHFPGLGESRRRSNIRAVLLGLRFLEHSCEGFDVTIFDRITELRNHAIAEWQKEDQDDAVMATLNSTSEMVLRDFAIMRMQPPDAFHDAIRIKPNYHFVLQGKQLWLNPRMIVLPYQMFTRRYSKQVEFTSAKGLSDLMRETKYFLKEGGPHGKGNDWICLDLSILEKYGVISAADFEEI